VEVGRVRGPVEAPAVGVVLHAVQRECICRVKTRGRRFRRVVQIKPWWTEYRSSQGGQSTNQAVGGA
jgi:hypothetical protein